MRLWESPYIEEIDLIWGRQTGKSTTIYVCYIHDLAQNPKPALFLYPDQSLGRYTSQNRIQTHIDCCPPAADKKTPNKDDYSTFEMKFVDSVLSIGWAGSGSQIMSRPVGILLIDEVDEFKASVGKGESDPVLSAIETTTSFANRKIVITSTPSTKENHIWIRVSGAQYIFEYWVPCPHCGGYQILVWSQIKWPEDVRDPEVIATSTWYECIHCTGKILDTHRISIEQNGEWRARKSKKAAEEILRDEPVKIEDTVSLDEIIDGQEVKKVALHLPQWYSLFSNVTFGGIAADFLKSQGDFKKLQDWTKFKRALPYVQKIETKKYHELLKNKINLAPGICPADTIALTLTADPSGHSFYYVVLAWQQNGNRHIVEYGIIPSWMDLTTKSFDNIYDVQGSPGYRLRPWRIGVDTGGSKYEDSDITMTTECYYWLRNNNRGNTFGVKGDLQIRGGARMKFSLIDRMPGKGGHPIPGGLAMWRINTDTFKDALQFHIGLNDEETGRLTFHADTREDLISHLVSEEKRRNKDGSMSWSPVKKGRPNHWLDCIVYGHALADQECMGGVRLLRSPWESDPSAEFEERGGGWLDGIDRLR